MVTKPRPPTERKRMRRVYFLPAYAFCSSTSPKYRWNCSFFVEKAGFLGLFLTPNLSWEAHIENVFIHEQKLAYSMKRVGSAGAPCDKLLLVIDALIILLILYCSPVISPALRKPHFVNLRGLVSLISKLSYIPYD